MGRRNNGLSEQWAVGIMGCRNNGSSELWAVGIMTRNPVTYGSRWVCSIVFDNHIVMVVDDIHVRHAAIAYFYRVSVEYTVQLMFGTEAFI